MYYYFLLSPPTNSSSSLLLMLMMMLCRMMVVWSKKLRLKKLHAHTNIHPICTTNVVVVIVVIGIEICEREHIHTHIHTLYTDERIFYKTRIRILYSIQKDSWCLESFSRFMRIYYLTRKKKKPTVLLCTRLGDVLICDDGHLNYTCKYSTWYILFYRNIHVGRHAVLFDL